MSTHNIQFNDKIRKFLAEADGNNCCCSITVGIVCVQILRVNMVKVLNLRHVSVSFQCGNFIFDALTLFSMPSDYG